MADNKELVPVYFIGVHYPPTKNLFYTRHQRVYRPQMVGGKLVVGGVMQVDPADVREIIKKSQVFQRNKGFFETFTTDPAIAAAVRTKYEQGQIVNISSRLSLEQASALLSPEENKKAVVEGMTVAELEAVIAQKLGEKTADKQPEKIVEEKPVVAEKPVAKPKGKASKDSEVVDELLK